MKRKPTPLSVAQAADVLEACAVLFEVGYFDEADRALARLFKENPHVATVARAVLEGRSPEEALAAEARHA